MSLDKFGRYSRNAGTAQPGPPGPGFIFTPDGQFDMQGKQLKNLKAPSDADDAATKDCVDKLNKLIVPKSYIDKVHNYLNKAVGDLSASTIDNLKKIAAELVKVRKAHATKELVNKQNSELTERMRDFEKGMIRKFEENKAVVEGLVDGKHKESSKELLKLKTDLNTDISSLDKAFATYMQSSIREFERVNGDLKGINEWTSKYAPIINANSNKSSGLFD